MSMRKLRNKDDFDFIFTISRRDAVPKLNTKLHPYFKVIRMYRLDLT